MHCCEEDQALFGGVVNRQTPLLMEHWSLLPFALSSLSHRDVASVGNSIRLIFDAMLQFFSVYHFSLIVSTHHYLAKVIHLYTYFV